jgi:hypothetical protein
LKKIQKFRILILDFLEAAGFNAKLWTCAGDLASLKRAKKENPYYNFKTKLLEKKLSTNY